MIGLASLSGCEGDAMRNFASTRRRGYHVTIARKERRLWSLPHLDSSIAACRGNQIPIWGPPNGLDSAKSWMIVSLISYHCASVCNTPDLRESTEGRTSSRCGAPRDDELAIGRP